MKGVQVFRAFFSYARADAEADPILITSLTEELEKRVNVKFTNDRMEIWRDIDGLRLGERWGPKIEGVLRQSDILIVLLTPRWLGSPFCRTEYAEFEKVESQRASEEFRPGYVSVILAREIDMADTLTRDQKRILVSIKERQHFKLLASDFLRLPRAKRTQIIDSVADDIRRIVERRRTNPGATIKPLASLQTGQNTNFIARPFNFKYVDFISNAEVVLDRRDRKKSELFAQIDFAHCLYIEGVCGRVEFGIRRAYLTLTNDGPGELKKVQDLKSDEQRTVSYVTLHDDQASVTVCMDPPPHRKSLAEMALPPARNEDYLSKIAEVDEEVKAEQIKAELRVSLEADDIHLVNLESKKLSKRATTLVRAVIEAVVAKEMKNNNRSPEMTAEALRRTLTVVDRSKNGGHK